MLAFNKTQTHLVIGGKTFYAKEAIKAVGGSWDPSTYSWNLPVHLDSTTLRNDLEAKGKEVYEEERKKKKEEKQKEKQRLVAQRIYDATPEGIAQKKAKEKEAVLAALEQNKKNGAFHWICCEQCEVIDWGRKHTSCMACAEWNGQTWNSFRVRGSIFTGD